MNIDRRSFLRQTALGALQFGILTELLGKEALSQSAGLPRSAPHNLGVDPQAIIRFVQAVNEHNLHSLMILKKGHVVAEGWWAPYAPELKHTLYSLSKSFTSTAIGFAVSEGKLALKDKVISFFPGKLPADVSENLAAMTIQDLLTMTTGHAQDTVGQFRATENGDWITAFLQQPVSHRPGTHFVYNSGATYMLSAILKTVTGENLTTYLKPRLFDPLGSTDYDWEVDPEGIQVGGWGLRVTTEDIAKFGQLYLQKGQWNGKKVLSPEWVAEATTKHILQPGKDEDRPKSDWLQGYGYQFWRCRNNCYRGDGAYGQYCIVLPDQEMVIAITSETSDMQAILNHVWAHLLPTGQNPANNPSLKKRLNTLALPLPGGSAQSTLASTINGSRFKTSENTLKIAELSVEVGPAEGAFILTDASGSHSIPFGVNQWKKGKTDLAIEWLKLVPTPIVPAPLLHTEASAYWKNDQTLELTCRFVDTAHYMRLTCVFDHHNLSVSFQKSIAIINKDEKPFTIVEGTKIA
jgi:CubicO group peptidase (beta-lactamase class C family)